MSKHSSKTQDPHPNSEVISLYHDGEGDPELLASVEEHLESCDECRGQLAALRRLSGVLTGAPDLQAPAELFARVSDDIRRPQEPPVKRARITPMWVGQAAAILVVGILGVAVW